MMVKFAYMTDLERPGNTLSSFHSVSLTVCLKAWDKSDMRLEDRPAIGLGQIYDFLLQSGVQRPYTEATLLEQWPP